MLLNQTVSLAVVSIYAIIRLCVAIAAPSVIALRAKLAEQRHSREGSRVMFGLRRSTTSCVRVARMSLTKINWTFQ